MKKLQMRVLAALLVTAALSYSALAQGKAKTVEVTIGQDILVNETLVKKGSYKARFDTGSGEISLLDGGKVIATAKGRVVENNAKSRYTALSLSDTEKGRVLIGMSVEGDKRTIVIGETAQNQVAEEK